MFLCHLLFLTAVYNVSGVRIPEYIINELYSKYEEAMANDNFKLFTRRIFKGNKQFEIHVEKLREVNGYKKHNLMVRESLKTGADSFIYINNPVESRIPKAYLTLDEFKDALTNRVLVQRKHIKKQPKTKQNLNTMRYMTGSLVKNESGLHGNNQTGKYVYRKATVKPKPCNIGITTNTSNEMFGTATNSFNKKNTSDKDNANSSISNEGSKPPETERIKLVSINNTSTKTDITLTRDESATDVTTLSVRIDEINESGGILNVTDLEKYTMGNESDAKITETVSGETNISVLKTDTPEITQKATPRRKVTEKLQSVTTATTKRITLGRPLVFLAN